MNVFSWDEYPSKLSVVLPSRTETRQDFYFVYYSIDGDIILSIEWPSKQRLTIKVATTLCSFQTVVYFRLKIKRDRDYYENNMVLVRNPITRAMHFLILKLLANEGKCHREIG